jgi:hypothetical protein
MMKTLDSLEEKDALYQQVISTTSIEVNASLCQCGKVFEKYQPQVGPGRYCSPRQRMPLEGSRCVAMTWRAILMLVELSYFWRGRALN